ANRIDLKNAEIKGTPKAMLDRLALDKDRIKAMADGLKEVVNLQDPVGEVVSMWQRPNGLQIGQKKLLLPF
ncbi:Gamma-glutamyl phosphate reductase, partial [human gut metagenome]